MSRAIGGYVRRCDRRVTEPGPALEMRGPDWYRHAVLPSGGVITWRLEPPAFETPLLPSAFLPLDVPEGSGEIMASLLGAPERPGPPYVHTFRPPEPIGQDEDGNDIYPEPGPAYTLTEAP